MTLERLGDLSRAIGTKLVKAENGAQVTFGEAVELWVAHIALKINSIGSGSRNNVYEEDGVTFDDGFRPTVSKQSTSKNS